VLFDPPPQHIATAPTPQTNPPLLTQQEVSTLRSC